MTRRTGQTITRVFSADGEQLQTSERAYMQIKDAIVDGTLPSGSRLVELTLASELGVSRTPIREALKRLTVEGLVTIDATRGTIVRPISPQDVSDFYAIREVLDGLAASLAAERISSDQLLRLRALLDVIEDAVAMADEPRMVLANLRFHEAVFDAASNERLETMGRSMADFVRRLSFSAFVDTERDETVLEEHRAILTALQARDPRAAEQAARRHMVQARLHHIRRSAMTESL